MVNFSGTPFRPHFTSTIFVKNGNNFMCRFLTTFYFYFECFSTWRKPQHHTFSTSRWHYFRPRRSFLWEKVEAVEGEKQIFARWGKWLTLLLFVIWCWCDPKSANLRLLLAPKTHQFHRLCYPRIHFLPCLAHPAFSKSVRLTHTHTRNPIPSSHHCCLSLALLRKSPNLLDQFLIHPK